MKITNGWLKSGLLFFAWGIIGLGRADNFFVLMLSVISLGYGISCLGDELREKI